MADHEKSVFVTGFPHGLSDFKVKLWIEKLTGPGTVTSIKKRDNSTAILFSDTDGLQKFCSTGINSIEFGGATHNLTVVKPEETKHSGHGDASNEQKANSELLRKRIENLFAKISQEDLYNGVFYWCDLPLLPGPENMQCVLAQNIVPSENSIQKVMTHFSLKKRSGGGPVKCLIQMIDGLLVIFENANDCESCIGTCNQVLSEKKLVLFPKMIPEYYANKFVLEGVGASTNEETLIMYLESCSKHERTPTCKLQGSSGVYLIEYDDNLDLSESEQLVENINSKTLEAKTLKAKHLIKTDCLKVLGTTRDISNDAIQLFFESKKHRDGGPVTRVDRLETEAALVYFALYTDAEKVYQKSKQSLGNPFVICDHPVTVELYYHSLADDHVKNIIQNFQPTSVEESNDVEDEGMKTVLLEPSCDKAILSFVFDTKRHAEALKKVFKDIAEVEFLPDDKNQIQFTEVGDFAEKGFDVDFAIKCKEQLNVFLSDYTTAHRPFEKTKLDRARSYNMYAELKQTFTKTSNDDIIVCWETDEPTVQVTGLKSSVTKMLEKITNQANTLICDANTSKNQYRIFLGCGIVDELRKAYLAVKIECKKDTHSLKITGLESDVNTVQLKALSMLADIHRRNLADVDESVILFMSEFLTYESALDIKLRQKFESAGVKGVLELDNKESWLRVRPNEDFQKCIDIIKQSIVVEEIKTNKAESEVLKSPNWDSFKRGFNGLYKIKTLSNGSVVLTGIKEDVQQLKKKIQDFLDEEAIRMAVIPMSNGAAHFIKERSNEFSQQVCRIKNIECGLSSDQGGGVFLKGKKHALNSAKSEAEKIRKSMNEVPMELNQPGIREYYKSDKAQQFFTKTAQDTNCVILDKSSSDQKNVPEFSKEEIKSVEQSMAQAYSAQFTPSMPSFLPTSKPRKPAESCKIQLFVGDIVSYQADVIVNPTTPQYLTTMANGPVISKKLAEKAGLAVQKQCKDLQPPHTLGKVFETDGGGLPCQKLYHALIENYDANKSKSIIDSVVSECLRMADQGQLSSIAFPAIATGGFNHPPNLVAKWMKQQILNFSGQYLKTAVIVLFPSNQPVIDAFNAEINSSISGASPMPVVSSQQSGPALNVQLVTGDIVSHQADVIVNVTTPQLLTDMASGPAISKALAQKAGPNVLEQCKGIQPPHDVGKVYETSGGGLPCTKLYHALVSDYDSSKSKSIIDSLVSESLKMAENDQYSSIAFPAIATGGFKHPAHLVAQWMEQQISNFTGQHLKTVYIVLYPKNQAVINVFNAQFNSPTKGGSLPISSGSLTPLSNISASGVMGVFPLLLKRSQTLRTSSPTASVSLSPPSSPATKRGLSTLEANSIKLGTCDVQLIPGDIVSQQADVIVNATSLKSLTDMTNGSVISKLLAKKAGQVVQEQCKKILPPHKEGKVYETDGGGLSCKKLYHAPLSDYNSDSKSIIESVVLECLSMADKDQYSSIAFPAIATGGFQHPPNLVAKWMKQQIENFKGQHLKTVFIVLYPKNQAVIDSFQAEFLSLGIRRSPSPPSPKRSFGFFHTISKKLSRSKKKKSIVSSTSFGPLTISVYCNDIASEDSDVMVNSTNPQFDLTKGVISSQLLNKGGQAIQGEVMSEHGNVCRVTSGGELPCGRVIHFVAPQNLANVRLMIGKALQEVEHRRLSSVSIPFFWTDNFGALGTKVIAREIRDSISKFVANNRNIKYLDEVKIVVWGKTDLQLVEQHILKAPVKGRTTDDGKRDAFKLFIFSTDKKNIDNAIRSIKKKMENVFQKQYVKNDAIPRLTEWENFEIAEVERKNNIRISANRHTKKMELVGMRKNIAEAAEEIKEIMQDFTAAETSAKYVTWQKKNGDNWENYAARSAYKLENAYMSRQKNTSAPVTVKVPEFKGGVVSYHTVDFSRLFDETSQALLKVRRRITEDTGFPSTWDMMGKNEQRREVLLTKTSKEYKNVLTKFQSSGPAKATIVSIERIQNKTLYEQYDAKKSGVTAKLKNYNNPIERQLFHGTDADDKIIIHGFDRGYAGKNATKFGVGVYFARDARYSDSYASANSKGEKRMFLADVITGKYCKGDSEMKVPPPIQNGDGTDDIYDSVVDKLENPSIFVIFRDISAYPAYRITYKLT